MGRLRNPIIPVDRSLPGLGLVEREGELAQMPL